MYCQIKLINKKKKGSNLTVLSGRFLKEIFFEFSLFFNRGKSIIVILKIKEEKQELKKENAHNCFFLSYHIIIRNVHKEFKNCTKIIFSTPTSLANFLKEQEDKDSINVIVFYFKKFLRKKFYTVML